MTPWTFAFLKAAIVATLIFALAIAVGLLMTWNPMVGFFAVGAAITTVLATTIFAPQDAER